MKNESVMLKNVRLSFPQIWKAKAFAEGQPAKFQATYLIDEDDTANLDKVRAVLKEMTKTEFKGRHPGNDKVCLRNAGDKTQYDGYEDGSFYISTSGNSRPLILDRDRAPLVEEDARPYAGCYVNAKVSIWAQDNQYGKRINASTEAIQFLRDGDSFGGGSRASSDDFDDESDSPVDDDDDDDFLG